MILYFSSTGNCKHTAEVLAAEFGDRAASITETDTVHLTSSEALGFVFPTYFWRLPSIVDEYMKKLCITAADRKPYIYFIATYGSTCGQTGTFMKRHLKRKGFELSFSYSIKTVDDWTVWFDAGNKEETAAALEGEKAQISEAISFINSKTKGNKMKNTLPMIAVMGSNVFYSLARRTKHLHTEEDCNGCGLCAKDCPTNAIEIKDGKPIWVKERCTMCLHCLHYCPNFAIQYDNKTKRHGQYNHP